RRARTVLMISIRLEPMARSAARDSMRTFPPTARAHRSAGFTLVEVMTTLAVLGLVAGAVMLAAPGADTRVHGGVERLAARLKLASDQSVLLNRDIALVATPEGYHFEKLEEDGWRRIENAGSLGFRAWPGGE